jgi:hypothetical protein
VVRALVDVPEFDVGANSFCVRAAQRTTNLAQALSRAGIVDEYRLVIEPAVLGAGLPMFRDQPTLLFLELAEVGSRSRSPARAL